MTGPASVADGDSTGSIGRLLIIITYVAVVLLVVGLLLMVARRHLAADRRSAARPGSLAADLVGLEPAAFLWLGILAVIATPAQPRRRGRVRVTPASAIGPWSPSRWRSSS